MIAPNRTRLMALCLKARLPQADGLFYFLDYSSVTQPSEAEATFLINFLKVPEVDL